LLSPRVVLDMFSSVVYGAAMPDTPSLRPATSDEIAESLSSALRYQGRKRAHHADDAMARITAERLVKHLEASGFVLMKGPPRGYNGGDAAEPGMGRRLGEKSRPPERPGELREGKPASVHGDVCTKAATTKLAKNQLSVCELFHAAYVLNAKQAHHQT
jgi:hypothetical protein